MSTRSPDVEEFIGKEYQHGFVTDIEADTVPPGLDEKVIRLISGKKKEPAFLLDWRLRAFEHWQTMREPRWPHVHYEPIDYQAISYFSAPKSKDDAPKSLDEVDPKLLETYEKLGIPLHERAILAGVAVDAVFDSVSVATTFKGKLAEAGVIFCSFSEAVQDHPELIEAYLGSVVPYTDNFFATLNSAVALSPGESVTFWLHQVSIASGEDSSAPVGCRKPRALHVPAWLPRFSKVAVK